MEISCFIFDSKVIIEYFLVLVIYMISRPVSPTLVCTWVIEGLVKKDFLIQLAWESVFLTSSQMTLMWKVQGSWEV